MLKQALQSLFSCSPTEKAAERTETQQAAASDATSETTHGAGMVSDYDSLMGRAHRHYTEIQIDPGLLPQIRLKAKPGNVEYLDIKGELLTRALQGLKPYFDFVFGLKGMVGRNDLHDALKRIVRRFVNRYWDMPASASNHHAYPWGFVLHCMDVACGEAELGTNWMPMSKHGIDEIGHAQDLGVVVLMYFVRGLYHDAHKIYQYQMMVENGTYTVRFDPLHHDGYVLDFKLVYPTRRIDKWGPPHPNPGKLNALEFISLLPRELWGCAPRELFFEVLVSLFDLVPCEADKESCKRDASRAGRLTLEEMIFNAITSYFSSEKSKTNPAGHVFRVSTEWVAINTAQFFLKVRPADGGVYTKEGVESCLMQQGLLAGQPGESIVSVPLLVKYASGKEKIVRDRYALAFVKKWYLQEACPGLADLTGEAFFLEQDREAVTKLCSDAANFIAEFPGEKPEKDRSSHDKEKDPKTSKQPSKETGKKTTAPKAQIGPSQGEQNEPGIAPTVPSVHGTGEKVETSAGSEEIPTPSTPEIPTITALPIVPETPKTSTMPVRPAATANPIVIPAAKDWTARLRARLGCFTAADCSEPDGWLFCGLEKVFVRSPHFYVAMTDRDFLQADNWGEVAKEMCLQLVADNVLVLIPIKGTVAYIGPGGKEGSVEGGFFQLLVAPEEHEQLLAAIYQL